MPSLYKDTPAMTPEWWWWFLMGDPEYHNTYPRITTTPNYFIARDAIIAFADEQVTDEEKTNRQDDQTG